jgi:tetratricopeptide (TPR) repeat protein
VAIKCNDDHEFQNPESSARAASAHPLLSEWTLDRERALPCAHWPVAAIPAAERGRVASAIPTLLLVGAFDPATPSSYAEFAAATLARAHVLEFPASGHGLLGSDRCVSAITEDFLDDPKTRPAAACLHAMRPVDFSPSIQMHAVALLAQGEPTEAEDALVRALAINGKAYGPDSLEAGKSAGRLALVYHDQGRTGQAASLYRRTLRILEREHGQNHADVSFYRSRYGELVSRSGAARP